MTVLAGIAVPLAHVGHWWTYILYAVPVVIVLGAVVRTLLQERREGAAESGEDGPAAGSPSSTTSGSAFGLVSAAGEGAPVDDQAEPTDDERGDA